MSMILFLTTCSLTKVSGGTTVFDDRQTVASTLPPGTRGRLLERREEVLRLVTGPTAPDWHGVRLSALEHNRNLVSGQDFGGRRTAAYLPAVSRYEGRLFQALGADRQARLEASPHHVLFLSGLYGLLRPLEPIQLYSCPLKSEVAELWCRDSLLTEILADYASRFGIGRIFDLTAIDAYRNLIDWNEIGERNIKVLHFFDSMAPGDRALTSFGKLLGSNFLDCSEDDLVGLEPGARVETVRIGFEATPPPEWPQELADIFTARQEAEMVQPQSPAAAAEVLRGGNPEMTGDAAGGVGWRLAIAGSFARDVRKQPHLVEQILNSIMEISRDPCTPRGNTIKPLQKDLQGMWRYRIGDYRLLYEPDTEKHIVKLCQFSPRGNAYD